MTPMTAKAAIARILKAEGVEFLSCFPANPIIDACAAEGIRPILARTERTVVNIADGYSRVAGNGRVGVCAMQDGAGIENAFAGVAQAYADSVPILILPGQMERRYLSVPPYFDALSSFGSVTKWAATIDSADRVPELMRRAFTALRTGRPGPVLLALPNDVAEEDFDDTAFRYSPVPLVRPGPDPADIAKAATMLLQAKRPLLLAGQGVHYAAAWEELRRLVELLRLPAMTSMGGKSALREDHPLALGVGAFSGTPMVESFLRETDLIFAIGSSLTEWWMSVPLPRDRAIIQSCIDERDFNKSYSIEHAILGDAKLVLSALIAECTQQIAAGRQLASHDLADMISSAKEAWLKQWMPKLTSVEEPVNPYRVIWDLVNTLDRTNTIITHDSGNPRDQLAPFYEALVPRSYIGWGHSTQLGYSLGLAMGLKLAMPHKMVVNVMGDAAFGMAGMDLETASRSQIGILTLLLNNSALGNYEEHIPLATERYRTKYLTGDYASIAAGLGAYSERVTAPAAIVPAIQRAIEATRANRPALVEVITCEEPSMSRFW